MPAGKLPINQIEQFAGLDRYPIQKIRQGEGGSLISNGRQGDDKIRLLRSPELPPVPGSDVDGTNGPTLGLPCHTVQLDGQFQFLDDHPRAVLLKRCCRAITTNRFDGDSLCRTPHECDEITDFARSRLLFSMTVNPVGSFRNGPADV